MCAQVCLGRVCEGQNVCAHPLPEARGSSQEELPHVQGAVAELEQEGQEELLHIQGQEGRL